MPKIVIVDKRDKVIGAEERGVAKNKGLIYRLVRIFLFNSKGQLFLQKRSPNKSIWPNRWDQSVGGHVDEGEDYYQAAVREMKEELGVEGVDLKKVLKFYDERNYDGKLMRRFNMLYKAVYDGELKLAKGEISTGRWFDLAYLTDWMKEKPNDFAWGCIESFKRYMKVNKS